MKRTQGLVAAAILGITGIVGARAQASTADQKVQLKDLPPVVRATVEAETKNATLKGLSREIQNGHVVYELESVVDGRTRDLMIDAAGKVYVIEEEVGLAKAPAPVKVAMEARGRIVKLESVTEQGRLRYEGRVQTKAGKTVALELNADGTPVKK